MVKSQTVKNYNYMTLMCQVRTIWHEKKEPCFTGGRTFQVRSVGWDLFFFLISFFSLSAGTNDSPQNYKNLKKKKKKKKKSDIFWSKILEKYPQIFSKIFSQICLDFHPKQLILCDFSKLKKTNKQTQKTPPKLEKLGRLACKTGFSFIVALSSTQQYSNIFCQKMIV